MRTPEQIVQEILENHQDNPLPLPLGIMTMLIVRTLRAEGWLDESQRQAGDRDTEEEK